MFTPVNLKDADAAARRQAADTFGRAMRSDPLLTWSTRGALPPERVSAFFGRLAGCLLAAAPDTSHCWVLREEGRDASAPPAAACIAVEYPAAYPSDLSLLRHGALGVLLSLAPDHWGTVAMFGRLLHSFDEAKARHKEAHGPFPYIACFGADPAWQGRGAGSALMRRVLAEADGRGLPVYLEANGADSARFYARHGFAALGEVAAAPGAPAVVRMARPARGPAR